MCDFLYGPRSKPSWARPPAEPEAEIDHDPATLGHGSFPPLRDVAIAGLTRRLGVVNKRLERFWPSAPHPARPGDSIDALLDEREDIVSRLEHFGLEIGEVERRIAETASPRFLPSPSVPEPEDLFPISLDPSKKPDMEEAPAGPCYGPGPDWPELYRNGLIEDMPGS